MGPAFVFYATRNRDLQTFSGCCNAKLDLRGTLEEDNFPQSSLRSMEPVPALCWAVYKLKRFESFVIGNDAPISLSNQFRGFRFFNFSSF